MPQTLQRQTAPTPTAPTLAPQIQRTPQNSIQTATEPSTGAAATVPTVSSAAGAGASAGSCEQIRANPATAAEQLQRSGLLNPIEDVSSRSVQRFFTNYHSKIY